jgi:hypothetical protein
MNEMNIAELSIDEVLQVGGASWLEGFWRDMRLVGRELADFYGDLTSSVGDCICIFTDNC